jgi:hypothetical protein
MAFVWDPRQKGGFDKSSPYDNPKGRFDKSDPCDKLRR